MLLAEIARGGGDDRPLGDQQLLPSLDRPPDVVFTDEIERRLVLRRLWVLGRGAPGPAITGSIPPRSQEVVHPPRQDVGADPARRRRTDRRRRQVGPARRGGFVGPAR